ncbi:MAG: sugar ABC transporter permease [Alphaproteobacteria bacterium]|nr:sugar ABC transporter permease [Alphaproteobacteria bacterium]
MFQLIRTKRHRELALVALFLVPSLAIFTLYRIVPLFWNLGLSFTEWSPFKPAKFAGLYHYEEMLFYDDVFWTALWNTVVFMASAPIAIALALAVAMLVNGDIRGRNVYRAIVFLSYPLMTVAVGIIWRWLFDGKVGLINYVLRGLGLTEKGISFLDSFEWAMASVVVAAIWQVIGFFMIILLTGLQSIPRNLHEAAAIDGAGAWQRFRRVTLPLLRPSIFLCLVIGIINSFTSFDLIYVMTGGGPANATELLITYVYRAGFVKNQFDYAAALTVALFVFFLGLTWIANRASGGDAGAVETGE